MQKSKNSREIDTISVRALAEALSELYHQGIRLLVGHGAGSYGHPPALRMLEAQKNGDMELAEYWARGVTDAMQELHTLVLQELSLHLPVQSVIPRLQPDLPLALEKAWKGGQVPCVHGDLFCTDGVYTVRSTEQVFCDALQQGWMPAECWLLGDYRGVLHNPNVPVDGHYRVLKRQETPYYASVEDSTGGMKGKVQMARAIADKGAAVWIANLSEGTRILRQRAHGEGVECGTRVM